MDLERPAAIKAVAVGFAMSGRLRYVDATFKRNVYAPGDDDIEPHLHSVDMSSAPFPNYIRAWREFRHITQDELAEMLGCSKASIGHWENGVRQVAPKWLHPIAEALHTTPGYLLDHDPNDMPTAVLDIWASIPVENRAQALAVLETFKKTGTDA